MDKLNVVVLTNDIDLRIHVKNHIIDDDMVVAGYSEFGESAKLKVEGMYPDVIICAVRGEIEESILEFLQELQCNTQDYIVLLMTDTMTVDVVNKSALFGIRNVLPLEIEPHELCESIRKVYSLEQQRQMSQNAIKKVRSRAICFFGGKGGTGKTTVAINVAVALARKGKRVAIIDLDLQFGDVAMALDIEPKDTIVELVQDRNGITIENITSFSMVHNSGVMVLAAPKSPEYAEYVSPEQVEKIIDTLRPYYEFIIVDLPPTFNDISIACCESCDEIILVYNMDILSLKNAKVSLNVLDQLHQKDKAKIVINKNTKGLIKEKDFEKMFEFPVFFAVSMDSKAATISINKGQPVVIAQPRSAVGRELISLAADILDDGSTGITYTGRKKRKFGKK